MKDELLELVSLLGHWDSQEIKLSVTDRYTLGASALSTAVRLLVAVDAAEIESPAIQARVLDQVREYYSTHHIELFDEPVRIFQKSKVDAIRYITRVDGPTIPFCQIIVSSLKLPRLRITADRGLAARRDVLPDWLHDQFSRLEKVSDQLVAEIRGNALRIAVGAWLILVVSFFGLRALVWAYFDGHDAWPHWGALGFATVLMGAMISGLTYRAIVGRFTKGTRRLSAHRESIERLWMVWQMRRAEFL